MRSVLILSDSLALPRGGAEAAVAEQTWPFLLRATYPHVYFHQLSIGGGTIRELRGQVAYLRYLYPELIIVQQGIVDCAPRSLRKTEQFFVSEYRLAHKAASRVLPRIAPFLRRLRRIVATRQDDFAHEIGVIDGFFDDTPVFWIGIMQARAEYERRVPGIGRNIEVYNRILRQQARERFVEMSGMPDEGVMSDHHHLNEVGHDFVFEGVKQKVESFIGPGVAL